MSIVVNAVRALLRFVEDASEAYSRCDIEHEIFSKRYRQRPTHIGDGNVSNFRADAAATSTKHTESR